MFVVFKPPRNRSLAKRGAPSIAVLHFCAKFTMQQIQIGEFCRRRLLWEFNDKSEATFKTQLMDSAYMLPPPLLLLSHWRVSFNPVLCQLYESKSLAHYLFRIASIYLRSWCFICRKTLTTNISTYLDISKDTWWPWPWPWFPSLFVLFPNIIVAL